MKILGIESTCDETAAAVVEDGRRLLSNVVHSQIDIHAQYGGVIPEVAARSHIEMINPVIVRALEEAGCDWDDIDAIAVAYAPGLIGSLLVGTLAARTLAILHDKPLYGVHHVKAHVYANFIVEQRTGDLFSDSQRTVRDYEQQDTAARQRVQASGRSRRDESTPVSLRSAELPAEQRVKQSSIGQEPEVASSGPVPHTPELAGVPPRLALPSTQPTFPMLALIVSGKHSELVIFRGHDDMQLLGQTQDDAVGEAFDKVARVLGLPYPGGPQIARVAMGGDPLRYKLPIARLDNPYDFSFSGLKTAVLRAVQREVGVDHTFPSSGLAERLTERQKADFAASFQYTAVKTLVQAARKAYDEYSPASVVIAGGAAANRELRDTLRAALPVAIEYVPIELCTDNGAMVAALAYYVSRSHPATDPYSLEVDPSLSMAMR